MGLHRKQATSLDQMRARACVKACHTSCQLRACWYCARSSCRLFSSCSISSLSSHVHQHQQSRRQSFTSAPAVVTAVMYISMSSHDSSLSQQQEQSGQLLSARIHISMKRHDSSHEQTSTSAPMICCTSVSTSSHSKQYQRNFTKTHAQVNTPGCVEPSSQGQKHGRAKKLASVPRLLAPEGTPRGLSRMSSDQILLSC